MSWDQFSQKKEEKMFPTLSIRLNRGLKKLVYDVSIYLRRVRTEHGRINCCEENFATVID